MKRIIGILGTAFAVLVIAAPAQASLIGANVQGTLGFGYPPGTGQFWAVQNQVIGAGLEYFYEDDSNRDTVDFFADGLVIEDLVKIGASGWIMTFQSTAFLGATLIEAGDNFTNGGVSYGIVGDTLTFTWDGTGTADGLLTASYRIVQAVQAVPEPGSLSLLGLGIGLVGFGLIRRRRLPA